MTSFIDAQEIELQRVVSDGFLTRPSEDVPVWVLSAPRKFSGKVHSTFAEQRKKLSQNLTNKYQKCVVESEEDPVEDGLNGTWCAMGNGMWSLPDIVDVEQFYEWLYMGNWFLFQFCGESLVPNWSRLSSRKPEEIFEAVKEYKLGFCVYGFLDNDPWTICLNPDSDGVVTPSSPRNSLPDA